MAFTFIDGVENFAFFFIEFNRHQVEANGETYLKENFYAFQTA
jgi:hypothetical protein